jgi:hypothetical protein
LPLGDGLRFYLGKFLELNGLVLLGFGLVWGVVREDMMGELTMLAVGAGIFLVGYLLERKSARRG